MVGPGVPPASVASFVETSAGAPSDGDASGPASFATVLDPQPNKNERTTRRFTSMMKPRMISDVHPYRQPQELPKPPPDPMRIVVLVAGGIAALIALAAIGLGVSERFTKKEEPVVVARKTSLVPPPPTSDVVVHHVAGPRVLPDGPLAFMASGHTGDVYTTTWIIEDGRATLSMSAGLGGRFCERSEKKVSTSDLAALAGHA